MGALVIFHALLGDTTNHDFDRVNLRLYSCWRYGAIFPWNSGYPLTRYMDNEADTGL